MQQGISRISALLFVAALIACGGSDNGTQPLALAGAYTATEFVTTNSSGQTNQLTAGSTLTITLNSNGSTTGHLHIAASGGDPAFDADMAGTWTQSGMTVNFSQSADTFVRNMPFTAVAQGPNWSLVGNGTFSGTSIHITLTRS
ncbi:MAG TPA: hypothetical protein VJ840_16585 [Gemmatimonadaceae bacterium]|nr:hypothetical protein [Gemmatimonadaceae bacterium]